MSNNQRTTGQKFLVVNADDFGLSRSISEGIIEAFERNQVSDVSILSNSEAFEYAVALLKGAGGVSCGVHLCCIDKEIPLTKMNPILMQDSHFILNRYRFLWTFLMREADILPALEAEFRAQIDRVLQTGLKITHLDSHQHLHIFPGIAKIVLRLCEEYNIPFIRVPFSDRFVLVSIVINVFSKQLQKLADQKGIKQVKFLGFRTSGCLTERTLKQYLREIGDSKHHAFELMVHPGHTDANLLAKYAHWNYAQEKELKALQSLTSDVVAQHRIQLVNFEYLAKNEMPTV